MRPTYRIIGLAAAARIALPATARADGKAWEGYQKGVQWADTLEKGKERATREGKLMVVWSMPGDMSRTPC